MSARQERPGNAIVFLGGGRITAALVEGLRRGQFLGELRVFDRHKDKLRRLAREFEVTPTDDLQDAAGAAGLLMLAVRPPSVHELLVKLSPLKRPTLIVSLAVGITLRALQSYLGAPALWARAMPSPACRIGRGLTAVAFSRGLGAPARRRVWNTFATLGTVLEVPEGQFDAFTVVYSPSHGYHAVAALSQAAQKLGLSRSTALAAAAHGLVDGILYWREGSLSLHRLLSEAATPGGTAAAVIQAMDAAGYKRTIERGLRAGMARAKSAAHL